MRPVCIIVRDGWGHNTNSKGNAVLAADTPNVDSYKEKYPWTLIHTSGEPVGLPDGFMGSSEVGHLNLGAGRIVVQELKRIDEGFKDASIFNSDKWRDLISNWKENNSNLHLMGLLQDEGVHAHQDHLFKIMKQARLENPDGRMIIHPFLDGRDSAPKSAPMYLATLNKVMQETGNCTIGTMMGRYYSMDRAKDWDTTDKAYHALILAQGREMNDAISAVEESYQKDKTPDNVAMFDEYIPIHIMQGYQGIKDGDSVFHFNYRQDRATQLTKAFVDDNYPGKRTSRSVVTYLGFTRYYDELEQYLMGAMGGGGAMDNLLGEVISNAGLKQLRISETQKFPHVTSFFNGKSTTPSANEDQVELKSEIDPAAFASFPQMEAAAINEELLKRLQDNPYAFIVLNYPNADMVGHTGDFDAAKKAVEFVDQSLGPVIERLLELDAHILLTADHGNSEQMIDYETGMTKTSHTTFDVEMIYIANDAPGKKLIEGGKLSDLAPTTLKLLGLEIPKEMTANVLIEG
ncbi:MAG: 2,3-bisphosphoglycerate-independent phosphoglycerate mutase [Calditrichaeota bacterium]|nr:MAG: 2,3-bisphosphoglycerate-independent phosphoglycerate mutase [Calditrichota bacterium]MBL1205137.1 2,3-bisphosphoglycerate-independent phosphoglycerate mutase [Calditrichota bacterium]NOG44967.1 2,3-bisphosphoglycerate-independent phosphoglycerate mutase [Calditrichota bacterium]